MNRCPWSLPGRPSQSRPTLLPFRQLGRPGLHTATREYVCLARASVALSLTESHVDTLLFGHIAWKLGLHPGRMRQGRVLRHPLQRIVCELRTGTAPPDITPAAFP